MPVKISRYNFRVFVCAGRFVISSIPGKFSLSFPRGQYTKLSILPLGWRVEEIDGSS